jgi:hydrocephalus-inducing protein
LSKFILIVFFLSFSGSVIPPTFKFDLEKVKFGLVSYGFKYTQTCVLRNTSLVPMSFYLRVASDDIGPFGLEANSNDAMVVDEDELLSNKTTARSLQANPSNIGFHFKEFSIKPSNGVLQPQSEIKVHIDFVPHFIKNYDTSLIIDIEDVASDLFYLPITARSTVPSITLVTPFIEMGRCFIYHSYEKVIRVSNDTNLKAKYSVEVSKPNPNNDSELFNFQSKQAEGIIEANSIKDIIISAEALMLGDIEGDLFIRINGSIEAPLCCHFLCLSQGPVVQIHPKTIDWGLTTVLRDSVRDIVLSNESLIEAKFKAVIMKRHSAWRVEPKEGVIQPGTEITVKAICYMIDKIKYDDVINMEIEHAQAQQIRVRAQGGGSSIVSEPAIGNLVDFGTYFSGGGVKRVFTLTNKSSRQQNLSFLPDGRNLTTLNKKELAKEKMNAEKATLFRIEPSRLELYPNETKQITIEGFSDRPRLAEETFQCHAIVGKTNGKDRIMRFKIRCEFIAPLVSFSTDQIEFRCEHVKYN